MKRLAMWTTVLAVSFAACGWSGRATGTADGPFYWTITTSAEIDAPPARVWAVIVNLPAYHEWNPFIVEAAGTVAVGEKLRLRMALPGRSPMTIKPQVLVADPGRELRWKGKLGIPGLFDGEHSFVLEPTADGRTRLVHWERFSGVLLPIAKLLIYDATVQSFEALNAALAKRAASPGQTVASRPAHGFICSMAPLPTISAFTAWSTRSPTDRASKLSFATSRWNDSDGSPSSSSTRKHLPPGIGASPAPDPA